MAEAPPLHEARALLRTFTHTGLRTLEVKTERLSLFLSRDPAARYAPRPSAAAPAPAPTTDLAAPHLGTLTDLAPLGTRITAGQPVATLRVLERDTLLLADADGEIVTHHQTLGTLLEYGQPVLTMAGST